MKKLRRCTCGGADEATSASRDPTGPGDEAGSPREVHRGEDVSVSASNDGSPTSDAGTDDPNARRSRRASGPTSPADAAGERETSETNDDENQNQNQNQNENESDADSEDDDGACERCASAFYAELEREMTAASKAYFGWTLKILTRAPLGGKSPKSGVYKK